MKQHSDSKEFSRFLEIDKIGHRGAHREIAATAAECRALADRFDLQDIRALSAELRLRRVRGDAVRLEGRIQASVVQTCVISLQPVQATIDEEIAVNFADSPEDDPEDLEISYDDDPPEPIVNGRIDLGEAVAQQLALALDPYPRAPGAEIPADYRGESADLVEIPPEKGSTGAAPDTANPFSVLGKLKD